MAKGVLSWIGLLSFFFLLNVRAAQKYENNQAMLEVVQGFAEIMERQTKVLDSINKQLKRCNFCSLFTSGSIINSVTKTVEEKPEENSTDEKINNITTTTTNPPTTTTTTPTTTTTMTTPPSTTTTTTTTLPPTTTTTTPTTTTTTTTPTTTTTTPTTTTTTTLPPTTTTTTTTTTPPPTTTTTTPTTTTTTTKPTTTTTTTTPTTTTTTTLPPTTTTTTTTTPPPTTTTTTPPPTTTTTTPSPTTTTTTPTTTTTLPPTTTTTTPTTTTTTTTTRDPNQCQHGPCFPGVVCQNNVNLVEGYQCGECPSGMTGDGMSCYDINECLLYNPCSDKSRCINYENGGGFRCEDCPRGYRGRGFFGIGKEDARRKQVCIDVDECVHNTSLCPGSSLCVNTPGLYYCSCPKGWIGPELGNCTFAGYCNNQVCGNNSRCVRNALTERCKCDNGYSGDGVKCGIDTDLDGIPDEDLECKSKKCKADNCRKYPNSEQNDLDGDGTGDACDPDADGDGIPNSRDNCPYHSNRRQHDRDLDTVGNKCDNCINIKNTDQLDTDDDGLGDVCDDDIDNDGIMNRYDNCVIKANTDQRDKDRDGVGDVCDNCPDNYNPKQKDDDKDGFGDVCDDFHDRDADGIPDHLDNCPYHPNSLQTDNDNDGKGDFCDPDIDSDGLNNDVDNCPYVYNPVQKDDNHNGRGNACEDDYDGDNTTDVEDDCPISNKVGKLRLDNLLIIPLDPVELSQFDPVWIILNKGYEAKQTVNSDPGIMVASEKLGDLDFEGTFFVNSDYDDDYIGFIFGFQEEKRFYVVMWKQRTQDYWRHTPTFATGEAGISIKAVNSTTGPGPYLRNALWHTGDTPGQVRTIWHDKKMIGWRHKTSYRWSLSHRPKSGLIRLTIYDGTKEIINSGCLFDTTMAGGRVGLFVFSQEQIIWSDVKIKCESNIPKECHRG